MADDFSRLVSLACHDLRTPLATVQGFAKTMLRMDELDEDKRTRYLGLIDNSADELASLLDLLSLAARVEGGRYEPVVREADSLALAPEGATGSGAIVRSTRSPSSGRSPPSCRPRSAGGVDVAVTVDGPRVALEPVTAEAAPIVLGESAKLGAAVAVRLVRALGGEVALDGERLS